MTIKVRVKQGTSSGINVSNPVITVPAVTPLANAQILGSITRLDELKDIVEDSPANNSTLIYNINTDKYEVRPLDIDNLVGDIDNVDGGNF